ncbi:exodeoxyribonuclease III [Akkermansiaceae bacterium]|nr:exodeoxyribonuclease III [bacterium]MDB4623773.1 exodeoxyribonuclease III [Akkermansiaceae bacterium]MDB4735293.1 exodeoxyribonuclease III [Akkermansiaceae bacterium]
MKLISWNVNGLRAVLKKNFTDFALEHQPDFLCLQETKARPEQVELPLDLGGYKTYWNSAEKAGYSGTCIFAKTEPLDIRLGIGIDEHDKEGRVVTLEYPEFFLVNVYTPNAQNELKRLSYRMSWDEAFLSYLKSLESEGKPVLLCGDLNVAHKEIDLARPKTNRKSAGFSDEERAGFTSLVEAGFVDTFRHFHPDATEAYSWWSYRGGARANNVGWRIDYWCVSELLTPKLQCVGINSDVLGSDHCPVTLEIDL